MAYEVFKNVMSITQYFDRWDSANFDALTAELKNRIYEKYVLKCAVFERDSYTCQNDNCTKTSDKITLHHIKWQKNNGENKERNCITLCNSCHKGYHRAKNILIFPKSAHLPSHIRGHTFKLNKCDVIDWKKVRADMKKLRKTLTDQCGLKLSWEQVCLLMQFLEWSYEEDSM